jgi:hypothetical protein
MLAGWEWETWRFDLSFFNLSNGAVHCCVHWHISFTASMKGWVKEGGSVFRVTTEEQRGEGGEWGDIMKCVLVK